MILSFVESGGRVAATTIQCGGVAPTTMWRCRCDDHTVWYREDVATTILCGIARTYLHREETVGVWALWHRDDTTVGVCDEPGLAGSDMQLEGGRANSLSWDYIRLQIYAMLSLISLLVKF
jgi:hypothetical protein